MVKAISVWAEEIGISREDVDLVKARMTIPGGVPLHMIRGKDVGALVDKGRARVRLIEAILEYFDRYPDELS